MYSETPTYPARLRQSTQCELLTVALHVRELAAPRNAHRLTQESQATFDVSLKSGPARSCSLVGGTTARPFLWPNENRDSTDVPVGATVAGDPLATIRKPFACPSTTRTRHGNSSRRNPSRPAAWATGIALQLQSVVSARKPNRTASSSRAPSSGTWHIEYAT